MKKQWDSVFIADLHLSASQSALNRAFDYFLSEQATQCQHLYLLGDLFEYWIGDDLMSDWHYRIADKIKALSRHRVNVSLMVGNRDFLLGKAFAELAGCDLLEDPSMIRLGKLNVLLKHGDDLCTLDKRHQWFRAVSRNPWVKKTYLSLPKKARASIAKKIRQVSHASNQERELFKLDAVDSEVLNQLNRHDCEVLIHGHTHNPQIKWFKHQGKTKVQFVLSDWYDKTSFLCYDLTKGFYFNQLEVR